MSSLVHCEKINVSFSASLDDIFPPPRRSCFHLGLSVRLFVCEQDNSKTYGRILIKFSEYMSEMVKGRSDYILRVIQITVLIFWINEI